MHEEKSHIKYLFVKLAIFVVLAICVFIFREQLIEHLKYFIGGLMLLYGVEEVLFEVVFHGKNFWKCEKTYLGLVELILGTTLFFFPLEANPEEVVKMTCVIWAAWSIIREAFEIRELVVEIKSVVLTIVSGIESIAVIVLSVMLILEPGEHHAMIHLYLLLAELVLTPLVPLLDEVIEERKQKRSQWCDLFF